MSILESRSIWVKNIKSILLYWIQMLLFFLSDHYFLQFDSFFPQILSELLPSNTFLHCSSLLVIFHFSFIFSSSMNHHWSRHKWWDYVWIIPWSLSFSFTLSCSSSTSFFSFLTITFYTLVFSLLFIISYSLFLISLSFQHISLLFLLSCFHSIFFFSF